MRRGRTTRSVWIIHVTHPRDDPKKDVHFVSTPYLLAYIAALRRPTRLPKPRIQKAASAIVTNPPTPPPAPSAVFRASPTYHLPRPARNSWTRATPGRPNPKLTLAGLGHLLGGPLLGLEQLLDTLRLTGHSCGGVSETPQTGLNWLYRPLGSADPAAQDLRLRPPPRAPSRDLRNAASADFTWRLVTRRGRGKVRRGEAGRDGTEAGDQSALTAPA